MDSYKPDVWYDDTGIEWAYVPGSSTTVLVRAVQDSAMALLCRKASIHFQGSGLETGVSRHSCEYLRYLRGG